jgi:hypothetical protein
MVSMRTSNWVVAGFSVVAIATTTFFLYRHFIHSGSSVGSKKTPSDGKMNRRKKRALPSNSSSSAAVAPIPAASGPTTAVASTESKSSAESVLPKPTTGKTAKKKTEKINSDRVDCDSPIEDILKLGPEAKQQIFVEMMMRGEFFIQQGSVDRAVDYLVKGLGMIPNPGEVLMAFEQTLPEPVFKSLLERLQREGRKRVSEYFDSIHREHPQISFASKETKNEMTGHSAERWFMKAARAFAVDEVIFAEQADLISPTISYYADNVSTSQKYTSESDEARQSFEQLLEHCRETGSSAGLLLFTYISLLLDAEMESGPTVTGVTANTGGGPFSHYDHLRPAFRQPTASDLKEARLLRAIFIQSNANMQDFLTDDIYAAMKYTMLFNCYGFGDATSTAMTCGGEVVRNLVSTSQAKWIGLFHIASHMDHSCAPNAAVHFSEPDRSITVKAVNPIAAGDAVTVAFLPGLEAMDRDERQVALLSKFGVVCDCFVCKQ